MDFKVVGLTHVWEDLSLNNKIRPMALVVLDDGGYRIHYPEVDHLNFREVLTHFGALARSMGTSQFCFFMDAKFRWDPGEPDESRPKHPLDDYSSSVMILQCLFEPGFVIPTITFLEYKKPGKAIQAGEFVSTVAGDHEFFRWFFEGYGEP